MTGTRWTCPLLVALAVATPADAAWDLFSRKPRGNRPTDAQVKRLTDALRADADEAKRRAAVAGLCDADPRTNTDVIPALVAALRRDAAAAVREDAADAIGQFRLLNPVAGLALEAAAETDPVPAVRAAARQALWEYHLIGYRSARGADILAAAQTREPPLAPPAPARPPVVRASAESVTAVRVEKPFLPPAAKTGALPPVTAAPPKLPAHPAVVATPLPGPLVLLTVAPPPQLNVTAEPRLAEPLEYATAPAPRAVDPAFRPFAVPSRHGWLTLPPGTPRVFAFDEEGTRRFER